MDFSNGPGDLRIADAARRRAAARLEEAMALYKQEEALCLEVGNKDSLSISYGNRKSHSSDRFFPLSAEAEGGGEVGRITWTERISSSFALMPVALPFANATKKSCARGPWIRT
jgi:hypothetical protein